MSPKYVTGLQNLDLEITLNADNLTPSVLLLEGGNQQEIIIAPEMVLTDGTWRGNIAGQSIKTGDFVVQVQVEQPLQSFIIPLFPEGDINAETPLEFHWMPVNIPENSTYDLILSKQKSSISGQPETSFVQKINGINNNPFTFPGELPRLNPGENYVWQIQTIVPGGTATSPSLLFSWELGPVEPMDFPPGPELDFDNFKDEWKENFRMMTNTINQFNQHLGMIMYWIGEGQKLDEEDQKVQKFANLIKGGIGKGVTAFKKGGEEALKDVVIDFTQDEIKNMQQHAVSQVSGSLSALFDLEDMAIRQIGLGIAKGLTGVYPDRMADYFRRQLEISVTDLSGWIDNRYSRSANHPTLQNGITDMCNLLNRLDEIERDFEKAVEEAGFICIKCEIPKELRDEMAKLRMEIEAHIRMFGDTIDRIIQLLVKAKSIVNNMKAYEDIAPLGSFQGHSKIKTDQINKTITDCKEQFQEALKARKQ